MRYLLVMLILGNALSSAAQISPSKRFLNKDFLRRDVNISEGSQFYQSQQMLKYDVRYLKLDLSVQTSTKFISGTCSYSVLLIQPLDTFAIELRDNMLVDSVYVNDVRRSFTRNADHVYMAFSSLLSQGSQLDIVFYYKGTPSAGIFTGSDANGLTYIANVSESFQAREWFPAKQMLYDKIDSADIYITTAGGNKVGSNGVLRSVFEVAPNMAQHHWSTRYPMAYYLPSFAVANYMEYRNYAKPAAISPNSILVLHYLANNSPFFNFVKEKLDKTPRFIEKMSELFGIYPFWREKYGHSQAAIGGGMEHQTMTTLQNFDEHLVAHELAHQWFGDNVTCASWNDIWLNESFATYAQVLMQQYLPGLFATTAATQMNNVDAFVMSQPGGSVYVPVQDSYNKSRIFNSRLSYNKGSAVLHNLRFEMQSDSLFFTTLKTYQQKFKNAVATTADFKQVAEQVTGKNFTPFFTQWVFGEGYPTYDIFYFKKGSDTLVINITQNTSMPAITLVYRITGAAYKIGQKEP